MKTESFFVSLGQVFICWPKTALFVLSIVFAMLVMQLPNLQIDTAAESYLHPDAKPIVDYDAFRKEFGRDEFFVVVVTGVDVFSIDFLKTLKEFHEALALGVSKLQSVESLVNVRSIYGEDDDLIAEDLLEEFPETEEDLQQIKERIRGKGIYYGRLINHEEDTVAIFVKQIPYILVKNKDGSESFANMGDAEILAGSHEIQAVAEKFKDRFNGGKIYVGGTPAMGSYMSTVIQHDFGVFTSVALLMVGFFLTLLFKRVSGVFIPLTVMVIGIVSCISLMPLLGYPMQITTSILPSFLLAVCIGDSVHLLSVFYKNYDEGASKHDALLYALNHTGIAVLFTSLTTAAGLITFSISDIQPISSLGLFAALGSIIAFCITITMIPVLITLLPIKRKETAADDKMKEGGWLYRFTKACIYLSTHHPKKIVSLALVFSLLAMSQVPNLRFSQDSLTWFPDDTPVKQAIKVIENKITGSMPVEIVIDTGKNQGVLDPEFLQRLDDWLSGLEGGEIVGIEIVSINSLVNLVKETNQAFNGNTPEAYIVPDDQELIAQELLLIEMDEADDLYMYTDRDFRKTRITIIVPWADAIVFKEFQDILRSRYRDAMGPKYEMHITGVIPIFSTMFTAMIESAAQSYMIAALAITFMMILLMRGIIDGVLSMVPNFLPIISVIALMAIVDIPMDVFTILIGSIALGICVDDTVHFMHGFKTAFARHGDAARAIDETLMSTGRALMITSIVLFFGFMTFLLSDILGMDNFGRLTALCIVLALFADFIIAPALMMLRYGKKSSVEASSVTIEEIA